MGNNCCSHNMCPTHPDHSITKICLCQSCLQPLCDLCIQTHHQIHTKLGYPAQIYSYDGVQYEYQHNITGKKKNQKQEKIANQLAPTSVLLKQLTREYFQRGSKNPQVAKILQNLQIWKEMKGDSEVYRKISDFLKQGLSANKQIVGKEYSYLY